MTNTENETAASATRADLVTYAATARTVTADGLAPLLDAYRAENLNEAIEAARGEYLEDATGTPEDEAYNQAVSDVVAAIGALLEGK
jgi:hypothetical protein